MGDEEPIRFTAAEWRAQEAKRRCALYGHDWQILCGINGLPYRMHCERPCDVGAFEIKPDHPKLKE